MAWRPSGDFQHRRELLKAHESMTFAPKRVPASTGR